MHMELPLRMWRLAPHGRPALITKGRRDARRRQPDQGRPVRPARTVLLGSTGLIIGRFAFPHRRCTGVCPFRNVPKPFKPLPNASTRFDRFRAALTTHGTGSSSGHDTSRSTHQCKPKPRRPTQRRPVRPARQVHPHNDYRRARHNLLAAGRGGHVGRWRAVSGALNVARALQCVWCGTPSLVVLWWSFARHWWS